LRSAYTIVVCYLVDNRLTEYKCSRYFLKASGMFDFCLSLLYRLCMQSTTCQHWGLALYESPSTHLGLNIGAVLLGRNGIFSSVFRACMYTERMIMILFSFIIQA